MVLAELGRIRQNVAEYSGKRQIAVDCGDLVVGLLIVKSVETDRRV